MAGRPSIEIGTWYKVEAPGLDTIHGKCVLVERDQGVPTDLWLLKAGESEPLMVRLGPGCRVTPIPAPEAEQATRRVRTEETERSAEEIVGEATRRRTGQVSDGPGVEEG